MLIRIRLFAAELIKCKISRVAFRSNYLVTLFSYKLNMIRQERVYI